MGIFGNISRAFTGQGRAPSGARTAIVDASALTGTSDRTVGPKEKVQILNKLASFAEKEAISITAVLPGPPLREAADGDKYREITVRYAEKNETAAVIGRIMKKSPAGTGTIVVTSEPDTEKKVLAAGVPVMKASTFSRALNAEEEHPNHSNGNGGNRRRKNNNGNRRPQSQNNVRPPAANDEDGKIINDLVDPL